MVVCCGCFDFLSGGGSNKCADTRQVVKFSDVKAPACNASNFYISGSGTAYANSPLDQTKAYFELKVIDVGEFFVGVGRRNTKDLDKHLGDRENSWALHSGKTCELAEAGDIIGVSYDLSGIRAILTFYKNGEIMEDQTITGIKGEVWPCVSVSGKAMLQANFGQEAFANKPDGFEGIIFSMDMM